jgi:hypothetical protein
MNKPEPAVSGDNARKSKKKAVGLFRWRWFAGFLVLLVVLAAGTAAFVFRDHVAMWLGRGDLPKPVAVSSAVLDSSPVTRMDAFEAMLVDLNGRLDVLAARVDSLESGTRQAVLPEGADVEGLEQAQLPMVTQEEMARMRSDLTAVSGALGSLQKQIQEAAQSTGQVLDTSRDRIALAVAFTQLRAVADSGAPFAEELENLRTAAAQDRFVAGVVVDIEPLAVTGAPTLAVLREKFDELAGEARAAHRRMAATTWKDRVLAELAAIVTVRPIHATGETSDPLAAVDADMAARRLTDALDKVSKLPEPVRAVLKEWTEQAKARQRLDNVLSAIAAHIVDQSVSGGKATSIPVTVSPSGDST